MRPNVLITGTNGFIGGHIARFLKDIGFNVCGSGRGIGKLDGIMYYAHDWSEPSGDIEFSPDVIIHAAAISPDRGRCFNDYYRDNIKGTENVINYAREKRVKKIIYLSAVSAFGRIDGGIIDECSPHNNPSEYGLSKYVAEKIVESSEVPYSILIMPGVVGKGCRESWITRLVKDMALGKTVQVYNSEGEYNNILLVDDLCRFIECILSNDNGNSTKYVLGNEDVITVKEAVGYLHSVIGSQSFVEYINDPMGGFVIDVSASRADGYKSTPIMDVLLQVCNEIKMEEK